MPFTLELFRIHYLVILVTTILGYYDVQVPEVMYCAVESCFMFWFFLVQMSLWLVFSGYFDFFFLVSGVISVLLSIFLSRKLQSVVSSNGYRCYPACENDLLLLRNCPLYFLWVLGQIAVSVWYVTKRVCGFCKPLGLPVFVVVDTQQESGVGAFLLANSITMTPGTVGASTTSDYKIRVLALESELLSGVTAIDARVKEMFCRKLQT